MSDVIIQNDERNAEISLIDLISIFVKRKWFIFFFTGGSAIFIFMFCLLSIKLPKEKTFLPNKYKPQAEMLINDTSSNSNSLNSVLKSSGLGSLADMIGAGGGGSSSNSALAQYLITSPSIQDAIIDKFFRDEIEKNHQNEIDLLKSKGKYIPENDNWKFPLMDTRDMLSKMIETEFDSNTGVFKISVEDKDPQLACDIINYAVILLEKRFEEIGVDKNKLTLSNLEKNIDIAYKNILNLQNKSQKLDNTIVNYGETSSNLVIDTNMLQVELEVQEQIYSTLKAQYETMKVTMSSEQPIFQILEYAQIPDRKSGPSRGKICVFVTAGGFFISLLLSFFADYLNKIKQDPIAMEKLHPSKKGRK